jgi:hypothetical protein
MASGEKQGLNEIAGELKILLSGMIAGVPNQGGATWAVLQYLLGFRRLGHDVTFVEQCDEASLRPAGVSLEDSENASYFERVVESLGLEQDSALLLAGTDQSFGVVYARLGEAVRGADVLINISGMLTDQALTGDIPIRVYLDLDPAFTQVWQASGIDMRFPGHTHFVTTGRAIGTPECPVPTCGLSWTGTAPPVVLAHWPKAKRIVHDAFTTVGNWRGYGSIEYRGIHYGQRAHSTRRFIALPTLTDADFLLALAIHPEERKDVAALAQNGWGLIDASRVASSPERYQQFIRGSRGELGIAKSGYVVSHCGWFSDRSACYLASGRPVIAQETGFSRFLPTSEGLFAFETNDDAVAAIEELERDYPRHANAARSLAEEYLDSDKVLTRLLQRVGAYS